MVQLIIIFTIIFLPLWCQAQYKKFLLNKDRVIFKDHVNKIGKNYQHVGYIDKFLDSANEFAGVGEVKKQSSSTVPVKQLIDRRRRKSSTTEHKIIDPFVFTFVSDKAANEYTLNSEGYGLSIAKEIFEDYSKKHNITYTSESDKDVRFRMFVQTLKLMHDDAKHTGQVRNFADLFDNDYLKSEFLSNNRNKRTQSEPLPKFDISWTRDITTPLKEPRGKNQNQHNIPVLKEFAHSWIKDRNLNVTKTVKNDNNNYGHFLELEKAKEVFEDYVAKNNKTFKNDEEKQRNYDYFVSTLRLNKILSLIFENQEN